MKEKGKQKMSIKPYSPDDEEQVIDLWQRCNLTRSQNNPRLDIERKTRVNPELFLVGIIDGRIVATVMAGYEGHRGWINYLGVDPNYQRQGFGRQIMRAAEEMIQNMGAPKINLQIRTDNLMAVKFYERIGYNMDDVVSMGKRLVKDS